IRPPQLSSNGNKGTRVQGHFSQAAPYCRKKGLEALIKVLPPSVQIPLLSDISAPDRNLFAVIYRGTWLSIAPLPYWVRADRQIFYDSSSKICVISLSTSRSFSTRACRSFSSCASSPRRASNFGDSEWALPSADGRSRRRRAQIRQPLSIGPPACAWLSALADWLSASV